MVHDLIRVFVHATAHDGGGCGGGGAAVRDTGAVPRVIPPRLLRGHGHGECSVSGIVGSSLSAAAGM